MPTVLIAFQIRPHGPKAKSDGRQSLGGDRDGNPEVVWEMGIGFRK